MLPDHADATLRHAAEALGIALTAVRDTGDMLHQHLIDSLSVLPALTRHLNTLTSKDHGASPLRILDVGSGAGLPGVVLAIALPRVEVCCVDTVGKKASFIRQVAAELAVPNLRAVHARVEAMASEGAQVITSRAFASLADFVTLTRHHLADHGVWMAMKGKPPTDELAALPTNARMFHVEPLQVPGLNAERCLVWMTPTA